MSKIFQKIKRRKICSAIIKSALFGFGFGTTAFAIPFAILKLTKSDYKIFLLILIALAAALVSGAVFLLLSVRSTLRIARAIDRKFALNEKVQTMIEYRKEEATMYQLQRDDAAAELKKVYRKAAKARGVGACIVAALLGFTLTVSAIVVQPPKEPDPPVITVPFEITDTQIKALEELAKRVRASGMYEPYKENIAVAIDTLTDELKLATTIEQRDASLNAALTEILKQIDDSSAACEFIVSLWGFESRPAKELAKALNYYDSTVFVDENPTDFLNSFTPSPEESEDGETDTDNETDADGEPNTDGETNTDGEESGEELSPEDKKKAALATALQQCAESIQLALMESNMPTDNRLYIELIKLVPSASDPVPATESDTVQYNLFSLAGDIEFIEYEQALIELKYLVDKSYPKLVDAMNEHKSNTDEGEGAVTQICSLFGVVRPAFERPNLYESSTGDGTGDGPGMGGIGNGTVYGSDDLVYDHKSNTYKEYGELLKEYRYEEIKNKINSGNYTKEEIEALEKYLSILYNGFDNTEKD